MSTLTPTIQWIQEFTGIDVATGKPTGEPTPQQLAEAVELEEARKQKMLELAHQAVAHVKVDFQNAMKSEIKVKGSFFKQQLLKEKGTQSDEVEFEDVQWGKVEDLTEETLDVINKGKNKITNEFQKLKEAVTDRKGKQELLFTARELEDGYWFPLTRERILPETYIAGMYSKTQRMLEETTKLYQEEVQRKKEQNQLTAKTSKSELLFSSASDVMSIAGDMVGQFGDGSDNAKLAENILSGCSQFMSSTGEAVGKLTAKDYADGSKAALGSIQILTKMVLSSVGVDPGVVDTVDKSFTLGGKAIQAGKHFARGIDGATDGVNVFADVLSGMLDVAASESKDKPQTAEILNMIKSTAPNVMRGAATSMKLIKALETEDLNGVVDCLGEYAASALKTYQGVKLVQDSRGKDDKTVDELTKSNEEETEKAQSYIDLGVEGVKMSIGFVIAAKSGNYQAAFNTLIDGIKNSLTNTLTAAGLPEDISKSIGLMYASASSGAKAVESLVSNPKDPAAAISHVLDGIASAFDSLGSENATLKTVGDGITTSLKSVVDGVKFYELCKSGEQGDVATAMDKLLQSIDGNFKRIIEKAGASTSDNSENESGNEGKASLKQALTELGVGDPGSAKHLEEQVNANIKKAGEVKARQEAEEEAIAIMEELKADLSDAEAFSRDAANIDTLIAKMQRDQMIMKIALQIMKGGSSFLATFIPGLGAAPAAIQMMASLSAAGQRAQQLYHWTNTQSDLERAQSALSTSAQNFVRNQAEQFSHHAIQAAFAAAEMIGQIIRVASPGSMGIAEAVGSGMVVASKAASKIKDIIRRFHKAHDLEKAWGLTVRAINNPNNRKLGLRARKWNPSLAKYSMAWGAVELKDPLAIKGMSACNLTEATLENESTNADKVVQYLETFYEEDAKLYREVESDAPWIPAEMQLNVRFWSKLKMLAVQNAQLANPDTSLLDGQLAQLKDVVDEKDAVSIQQRITLLMAIQKSFNQYKPEISNVKVRKAFLTAIKLVSNLAASQAKPLEKALEKLQALPNTATPEIPNLPKDGALAEQQFEEVLTDIKNAVGNLNSYTEEDDAVEIQVEHAQALLLIEQIEGTKALADHEDVKLELVNLRSAVSRANSLVNLALQD